MNANEAKAPDISPIPLSTEEHPKGWNVDLKSAAYRPLRRCDVRANVAVLAIREVARPGRAWLLGVALLVLGLGGVAAAEGLVGFEPWIAGGYHRSISLADNGFDLRGAVDLRLAFVVLGASGRFGSDRLDRAGTTHAAVYGDVAVLIPLAVARPYLRVGVGPCWEQQLDGAGAAPRIGLHQGIGVDFIVLPTLALGALVDIDESLRPEGGSPDVGLSALFVAKLTL